ncbi:amidohydrolase family protein (plasmid) [Prescottella equi]|uniref:amidohydrolase family protein n=1 Tax=Rhodococcus hoagii TaxID=43767 RepID=UPI002574EA36|nr:amidohydrolase family protein [Prescottella equi]WJJ14588.1 amidohydrolase family protein [Prescottella equi]
MRRTLAVTGIGTLMSGDLASPVIPADTVFVEDGKIAGIGERSEFDAELWIDAAGATVLPGLIDNHVHPVLGDYTPRQSQSDYLSGFVHGGVTSAISAGEVHTPGRPKDRAGTKALAILAHKAFTNYRPSGLRVYGGALLLEEGLTSEDFVELAEAGVHLVGEIGISGVKDPETAAKMTQWAQEAGMSVMVHVGGKSVPTSRAIDGEYCVRVQPDVAAHVNGGPTAPSMEDVQLILDRSSAAVELVYNGNQRAASDIAAFLADTNQLDRLVLGTDSPAGAGIAPAGIMRLVATMCSMAKIPAADVIATATGNAAKLRGIPGGFIRVGENADLVIADAPDGGQACDLTAALAYGDTPAVAVVIIDGEVVVTRSRNTAPPLRVPAFSEN